MNKFLTLAAVCTLAICSFTACEDVPAPYGVPSTEKPSSPSKDILLEKTFSASLDPFTNHTTSGKGAWVIDHSNARATGYDYKTKVTTAGTYYLVSSEIDLTGVENAFVALEYLLRYNKGEENQQRVNHHRLT